MDQDSHPYRSPDAGPREAHAGATSPTAILLLLMALAGLCHFNRVSISVAGSERLMYEFSLSEQQLGVVYTAYLVVYTLLMLPGGWLLDRVGPRRMLGAMAVGSAVFVAATALVGLPILPVGALTALVVVRGALGAVSVPMHPGAANMVANWFAPAKRASANGFVTAAALVGIALSYPLFGALIDEVGWRWGMMIAALVTAAVAVAWWSVARDRPTDEIPSGGIDRSVENTSSSLSDKQAVVSNAAASFSAEPQIASLILLTISYAAVGYFQYLFFYWSQYYFEHVLKQGTQRGRFAAMLLGLAMAAGMLGGGWLAARLQSRWHAWRGLTLVPMIGMAVGAVLTVVGVLVGWPAITIGCFALAMGAVGMAEGPFWTAVVEVAGNRRGTGAAFFNTGGNVGGLLAPFATPVISAWLGWQSGIALASLFCLLGAALWLWVRPADQS
ncbi:MAG: MFS transporter [Pirellulales bacterium]